MKRESIWGTLYILFFVLNISIFLFLYNIKYNILGIVSYSIIGSASFLMSKFWESRIWPDIVSSFLFRLVNSIYLLLVFLAFGVFIIISHSYFELIIKVLIFLIIFNAGIYLGRKRKWL
jgi:hypothetical protein